MQRSCRTRRRVSVNKFNGRNSFYKVSLSLVFLLWVLLFFSTLLISHGDGAKGNLQVLFFGGHHCRFITLKHVKNQLLCTCR